jgi:uncharacterized protein (DUF849 family)
MSDRRVFCCWAITGGMSVPGQSPALPVRPQEIVEKAMTLARLLDSEPADAAAARQIFGLRRGERVGG